MKFGGENLHVMPVTISEFCENRCSGSHVLLMLINEIFSIFSAFLI
jgi:hypothetical protein